jgi:hypothetical protein
LVGVDVVNSQPLVMSLVPSGVAQRSGRNVRPENQKPEPVALRRWAEDLLAEAFARDPNPAWTSAFQADCLAGRVYERVQAEVARRWRSRRRPPPGRSEVKTQLLTVMYSKGKYKYTVIGESLDAVYPGVLDWLVRVTQTLGVNGFPCYLQAVEADLMILGVADRLALQHPEVPFLTLHDSVATPAEHVPLVEHIIREVWTEEVGFAPALKTKPFADERSRLKDGERKRRRARRLPRPWLADLV